MVQGNTVAVMGKWNAVEQVRDIIEDCMKNVHPIYHIKTLMIKRELAKDEDLKNEDWSRFLPKFKKTNQKKKEKKETTREKKKYTPFPPPQQPSKIDLQLESGEYFLSEEQKKKRVAEERAKEKRAKQTEKQAEENKKFIAPAEPV